MSQPGCLCGLLGKHTKKRPSGLFFYSNMSLHGLALEDQQLPNQYATKTWCYVFIKHAQSLHAPRLRSTRVTVGHLLLLNGVCTRWVPTPHFFAMAKHPKRRTPILHTAADIEKSREAGQLAARVLEMLTPHVKPGVSTEYLDDLCNAFIVNELKCIPANIGYHGFPKTVCASVNHVVCHGIPSAKEILKDGDIVNIDVAIIKDGWYGDTSRMYPVGNVHAKAQRLIDTTYESMVAGIRAVKPGATLGDIGHAIQSVAQRDGFSVVRDYCGHGIGQTYHDEPQVLHYGYRGQGMVLQPGMIFTIEPMLNAGKHDTKELDDGWTVITKDKSLSAQWEHMVVVTDTGYDVLTAWPEGPGKYATP